MKIDMTKSDNVLTFILAGSIDSATAPDLERELKKNMDGVEKLYFDFSDVSFISSAGIRVILWAYKVLPSEVRKVTIKNAGKEIREVFELTGITRLLILE